MVSNFDIHNLEKILKDFYTIVRIKISIFDDEFNPIIEYPENASSFCENIRKTEVGLNACHACDHEACLRAKKLRKPHIYTCHAGITEAITPIQIGGGVVGYAILAQMLPIENYEDAAGKACELATKYGVSISDSLEGLKTIKKRTTEQINAAVRILDALSSYIYIQNLAAWKNEDLSLSIDKYIKSNLEKELSSEVICDQFHCSRSYLYKLSMESFGMGIAQYVTFCRVELAKQLLLEGLSIGEVANKTGFREYNYFCKVFRSKTGFSPYQYKKKISSK